MTNVISDFQRVMDFIITNDEIKGRYACANDVIVVVVNKSTEVYDGNLIEFTKHYIDQGEISTSSGINLLHKIQNRR